MDVLRFRPCLSENLKFVMQ